MSKGFFNIPEVKNEPVKSYAPGSPERAELKKVLSELRATEVELPMIIGGKEVTTEISDSSVTVTIYRQNKNGITHM